MKPLSAAIASALISCALSGRGQDWTVLDAELHLRLNVSNLAQAGVALSFDGAESVNPGGHLVFRPARWGLAKPPNGLFPGGGMDFDASFTLSNRVFRSESFLTSADGQSASWTFVAGDGARHVFFLTHPHTHPDPFTGDFHAEDLDVFSLSLVAPGAVEPGILVASADWFVDLAESPPVLAAANDCLPDFGSSDLALTSVETTAQLLRAPGDRVAFAPAARLQNVGANDLRWEWAIAPVSGGPGPLIGPHPFLVMNFYRLKDGRLEQLGRSDAKHAWNSTNEGCGCSSGQVMYQRCSDLYSANNNGNQMFFGPRAEINPFTGAWSSLGSHFDGEPVDNFRHHSGIGHGGFDHRLTVEENRLASTNDAYWVEAWYLSAQDTNTTNNIGYRGVRPMLSSGNWQFPSTNSLAHGPAIRAWVPAGTDTASARHTSVGTDEGGVEVAARVRRLPSGWFRYDYAVFNFDFARGLSGVAVPVAPGGTATNLWFADGTAQTVDDWTSTRTSTHVTWSASVGRLGWGEMRSYSLESPQAPAAGTLRLAVDTPRVPGESLSAASLVPGGFRLVSFLQDATRLRWESLPGATYHVERSAEPDSLDWTDISGPLASDGPQQAFTPPPFFASPIFYRVVLDFP